MSLPPIVVLDGEQRSALAVVRSLGRRGYPIHVGSVERKPIAGGSRFAISETRLPDPITQAESLAGEVARLLGQTGAKVLLPVTDASLLAVLEHQHRFPDVVIPGGDLTAFQRATDKRGILDLAGELGIRVPDQWVASGPAQVPSDIPARDFPVVLKPARSVNSMGPSRAKLGVSYVSEPAALPVALERLDPLAFPLLIQQRIIGPGVGVFLLRWNGSTVASFAHRRLRELPPSGGVSVACESIELPPALKAQAEALLERLDWSGVAMVEFKLDHRSGIPYLMEINPRFWGSLQLAVDAGVDFPWYLVRLALGETVEPVNRWEIGVRSRWFWGELTYLLARLRRSARQLDLPPDAPRRLRVIRDTLVPFGPRQRSSVFRRDDPRPFIRESVRWFRTIRG